MKKQIDIKRLMSEALHKGYMSDIAEGLTSPTPEVVTSPDGSTNGADDMNEEVFGDPLGDDLSGDTWGDAAEAFTEAVQDVVQAHAREISKGFSVRFTDDGAIPARIEDIPGVADDVVEAVLANPDLRETLVQIVQHTLKKRMT